MWRWGYMCDYYWLEGQTWVVMCSSTAGLGTTLCNTSAVNAAIASQQKSLWGILFSDQKTFPSRFIRLHRTYNDDFEEGSMAVGSLICKWEAASGVVYYVASSYCVDAIKQHNIHKLHSHCLGYKTCTKLIEKKTRTDSQEDFLWSSLDLRQQKQTRLT